MLSLSVKASKISNLTDARYFAAMGVDWLGFSLDIGAEDAVPLQQISAIKEWVEGPKIVGEFGLQSPEEIKAASEYLNLDAIQLGMFGDAEATSKVVDLPILKEVVVEDQRLEGLEGLLESQSVFVDFFILDWTKNGIDWSNLTEEAISMLANFCTSYKILFNLSISVESLPVFIKKINPHGLILMGSAEEKVGYKSYEEMDDILEFLEVE